MKIIFFGLLIAVLVVYGHGSNYDETDNVPQNRETPNDRIRSKLAASRVENDKKIKKIEKELEERKEIISILRAILSNPNLSTMFRSGFQKFLDQMVQKSELQEEAVVDLKQRNEYINDDLMNLCEP
ncbi:uncharacterized protein LOC132790820 isoform X1 [Drosophila nasuta]|uniref:uncharacterized protein LOC132790820 isoform X1 n=1 Tax=Drosophila nasuta TaxID=42062 RepID=UPI00295E4AC8|nr:uncharacterized protein LOC132790820 isoform X1 [Drosophila nasuta]